MTAIGRKLTNMMKCFLLLTAMLLPRFGLACSMECPTDEVMFEISDTVFYGRTKQVKEYGLNFWRSEPKIKVYFEIKKTWKGDFGNKPLKTIYNKFSCEGYWFQENVNYIVFIENGRKIDLCSVLEYSQELEQRLDNIAPNESIKH